MFSEIDLLKKKCSWLAMPSAKKVAGALRPDKWLLSISKAAPLSPYKFNKILI
jgi:hypothetical protein